MSKIRIMLADDHTLFRQGIRTLITTENDMEVIGEASNGGDAVDKCGELRPDVVLMDIGMPGSEQLRSDPPDQEKSARNKDSFSHDVRRRGLSCRRHGSRAPAVMCSRTAPRSSWSPRFATSAGVAVI